MIKVKKQEEQKYYELFLSFKYFKKYIEFSLSDNEIEIFVDNITNPTKALLVSSPAYLIYAKDESIDIKEVLELIKPNGYLIPNLTELKNQIKEYFTEVESYERTLFDNSNLEINYLETLKKELPSNLSIVKINESHLKEGIIYDDVISRFFRKRTFLKNGFGYALVDELNIPRGFCLTNFPKNDCDVELYFRVGYDNDERYRHYGYGIQLCIYFIIYCINNGYHPIWDSANQISQHIANKLGFIEQDKWYMYKLIK